MNAVCSTKKMSMEVLHKTLERVFESGLVGGQLSVVWHAGEPLGGSSRVLRRSVSPDRYLGHSLKGKDQGAQAVFKPNGRRHHFSGQ